MPLSTPLSARLGIQHPILSAPMDVIAGARLTAAVSAAGGFGILGGGYGDQAWLEQETAKLAATSAPTGSDAGCPSDRSVAWRSSCPSSSVPRQSGQTI